MAIYALNTLSGRHAYVSEREFTHPILGQNLVEAEEGAKDYAPELYRPKEGFEAREAIKAKAERKRITEPVIEPEPTEIQPDPENEEV